MSERDKRRDPRVETQQAVWVEGQHLRVSGAALNMSRGGMFVVAEGSAPARGTTVQITFDDPREGQIAVAMQVVWRAPLDGAQQLGLAALDEAGKATLSRVVAHYEGAALRPSGRPIDHPPADASLEDDGD